MNRKTILPLTLCLVLFGLGGCQESDSRLVQRARLVGTENLKLKEQIEEKNEQIAALKEKIETIQAENAKALEEAGQANIRILQIVAETEKRNQALQQENETLRKQLESR